MKRPLVFLLLFISFIASAQHQGWENEEIGCCKQHLSRNDQHRLFDRGIAHPKMYDYDIRFTFLDIDVTRFSLAVTGSVRYDAVVVGESLDLFVLEAIEEISIQSVSINGIACNYTREGNFILCNLEQPLQNGASFTAIVHYSRPEESAYEDTGIIHSINWASMYNVTHTLSEPFFARHWFPCKQVLEDKSDSCYMYLTCKKDAMVGSQGLLKKVVDVGDDKHQFQWESRYPIAYYLMSFAVSRYREYNTYAYPEELNGDSILIQNYIYDKDAFLEQYKVALDRAAPMLELFSDKYSLYPFYKEKYGHTAAPMGGAMEHQTMSTMGYWDMRIMSHELGHQWFGDNVTCGKWNDIWVNEGFATYSEYIAKEFLTDGSTLYTWLEDNARKAKQYTDWSVYVPDEDLEAEDVARIFSSKITYSKGGLILHMLRNEIDDDEVFFNIFKTYQQNYKDATATGDDFFNTVNEISGRDFDYFKQQWYYGKAYPKYEIKWTQDFNTRELSIQSIQTPVNPETPFFRMTNIYKITYTDNTVERIRLEQTEAIQDYIFKADKRIKSLEMNADLTNLCDVKHTHILSIDQIAHEQFSLYPNPANKYCQIDMMQHVQDAELKIYTTSGKCIYSDHFSGDQYRINTSELHQGIYLIDITTPTFKARRKLVVGA